MHLSLDAPQAEQKKPLQFFDLAKMDIEPSESGVGLLDEYWAALDGALYGAHHNTLRLNPRLFLLWKLQGYCTPVSEYWVR